MHIHHLSGYIQSIYLVEYEHGLLLLDGCSRADVELIHTFVSESLHRPITDLKIVVVTHMHPDHAGAAEALRKLAGCRILTSEKPHHWYSGLHGMLMYTTDLLLTFWVASRLKKPKRNLFYSPFLEPDIVAEEGMRIPEFEDWQILNMPGHTDRDLAVYHAPTHTIYVADLIVKVKDKFIPPFPVFHPNQYRISVNKLHDLYPSDVLLAHSGSVKLKDEDYAHLFDNLPELPKTHWRATKRKAYSLIKRYRLRKRRDL
ncbi:MBL fold metallo-hydrolase [Aestuariibacter sp. AA17]|uniref:MBL fold metallo-hydrolase n=1 Tax=Fluctibacter corallii TaxID=2984329 RepID=A0ABT3AC65_9ALTE|nr:MBL fold metallo-hydrolase [Aestuariibacter sp. AA17]MCV2885877.1 MBL fold metallo-hydrolase [Aestuariibacter sp. AA17]